MALSGKRFRRRKAEQIFADGYFLDHANDAVPGLDRADETFHLFGFDSPETDVQHNYGNLTLSLLDKYTNNALLDLVTGQDPSSTAVKQYRVADLSGVSIWANVKNAAGTSYVKSWIISSWVPGMPMPSGAPNDKAVYSVSGNGDLPRQFQGAWLMAKKVASGGAPSLGVTPVVVPGQAVYAVEVRAIDETVGFTQQTVQVSATLVDATGLINWTELDTLATDLANTPTDAYVIFLQTGAGVYPTVANTPDGLRI